MLNALSPFLDFPYICRSVHLLNRAFPLHAMITSFGHSRINDTGYRFDGSKRGSKPFVVFQYTLSGEGAILQDGRTYRLVPGSAMMVQIPHRHVYFFPDHSDHWDFLYVCMNGSEVLRSFSFLKRHIGPVNDLLPNETLHSIFHQLFRPPQRNEGTKIFDYSEMAYSLSMELLKAAKPRQQGSEEMISRVRAFCKERLKKGIGVEDMAEIAGISKAHFSRRFKEIEGISPREYLEQLRMEKAVALLYEELLSIKEIAFHCGFHDVNYFCKVFKKNYGLSPGKYRVSRM